MAVSKVKLLLFTICAILIIRVVSGNNLIVQTKVGAIRGQKAADGEYNEFMGIPYATVDPLNPFGLSIPNPTFQEVFDANDDSASCPQVFFFETTPRGSLDCLHLNIYVPTSANSTNRLPVLVWIHGGGFILGFHGKFMFGPKHIVKHDVILVTMNYRVNIYGFSCMHTPEIPGNQGLKDQLAGLRWIKDNIEAFGGDADKITLSGQSAGSISVHWHLLSPQESLFKQSILQSGTAHTMRLMEPDNSTLIKISQDLGYNTNNVTDAIRYLANVDPHSVIEATIGKDYYFNTCIEKNIDGFETLVTGDPMYLGVPKVEKMKIMMGITSDERLLYYWGEPIEMLEQYQDSVFLNYLHNILHIAGPELQRLENIVKTFYTGDANPSDQLRFQLADFISDTQFVYATDRTVTSFLANEVDEIYYYQFSYLGDRNFMRTMNGVPADIGGAVHGDENNYLFDMSFLNTNITEEDQLIIDRMTTMWTNFVKFGNPTPQITDVLPVKWEPVRRGTPYYYLNIDTNLTIGFKPFKQRTSFWDLFFNQYYVGASAN